MSWSMGRPAGAEAGVRPERDNLACAGGGLKTRPPDSGEHQDDGSLPVVGWSSQANRTGEMPPMRTLHLPATPAALQRRSDPSANLALYWAERR